LGAGTWEKEEDANAESQRLVAAEREKEEKFFTAR